LEGTSDLNTIEYNNIYDNTQYDMYNDMTIDVVAENNWWGTTDECVIPTRIYDYYDDNTKGKVDFCPYLDNRYQTGNPMNCPIYLDSCQQITSPGSYALITDVTYSGVTKCINIKSDNVVFDGCSNHAAIIHTGTYSAADYGVYISGRNSVTVRNSKICHDDCSDGVFGLSYGIRIRDSSDITLNNNIIKNTIYMPIVISNSNHVTITGNTIPHGMGFCSISSPCGGITLFSSNSNTISNNEISNVTGIGCGIRIGDSSSNTITGNTWGIRLEGTSTGNTIQNNNIYDSFSYDMYNDMATDVIAENNWWGTTNENTISNNIYDFYDDNTKGEVDFCPYLDGPYPGGSPVDPDDSKCTCEDDGWAWSSLANECCGDDGVNDNWCYVGDGSCVNGEWYDDHCTDGIKNCDETDVDIGGADCPGECEGKPCGEPCANGNGVCDGEGNCYTGEG
jgi:parallel beta-helix repeat protein